MSPENPIPERPCRGPQARTLPGQRALNRLIRALSRIPLLSQVIGQRLVILYVVGRKTRRAHAVPVAYMPQAGQLVIGTSFGWIRNLRSGESIEIRLKGRRRTAEVEILTTESEVIAEYAVMARFNATFAGFNRIRLDPSGEPNAEDLKSAWLTGARVIRLTPR